MQSDKVNSGKQVCMCLAVTNCWSINTSVGEWEYVSPVADTPRTFRQITCIYPMVPLCISTVLFALEPVDEGNMCILGTMSRLPAGYVYSR